MTVEAALAVASIVVVFGVCLGGVGAVTAHVRCVDAAREAARLTARGDGDAARSAAEAVAPRGARIDIRDDGDSVIARVEADSALPGVSVSAEAIAVKEAPGAGR